MEIDVEELLLEKCRKLIEEKLKWGSRDIWTNQDFEVLSERIENETKVNLSVATLKRIWGKVKYTSKPTVTTLDTLVQFIGYENWRVFKLKNAETNYQPYLNGNGHSNDNSNGNHHINQKPAVVSPSIEGSTIPAKKSQKYLLPVVVAFSGAIVFFLFFYSSKRLSISGDTGKLEGYSFTSKKVVSEGVPNSVIFEYDAKAAGEQDTIFIQQSWDTRLRDQVSRSENIHKSIYYYPGFFQAKLVVNNKIIKEHNLYIRSNDWLPVIEQSTVPVYFKKEDAIHSGTMTIPLEKIVANGIPLQPETPWVAFHNARTFGDLKSDNFIFETEVKNDYKDGAGICQLTEIHIRIEGGMFYVPLSIKGCVSKLVMADLDGEIPDTSPLGCDFSDWVKVRYEVRDGNGQIFINDKEMYDMNLAITPVKIVGVLYRFQGTGSVNYVRLSNVYDEVVYEENF